MPGRSMAATIFCIQFSPVRWTSSFTNENRPQNVKKTVVSIPMAAPVVARIICGQTLSRSPLHAMITSFLCACSSCSCGRDRRQVRFLRHHVTHPFFLITNRNTPPSSDCSTSSLPVEVAHAAKSGTEPGSVASDSISARRRELLDRQRGLRDRQRARHPSEIQGLHDLCAHVTHPFLSCAHGDRERRCSGIRP